MLSEFELSCGMSAVSIASRSRSASPSSDETKGDPAIPGRLRTPGSDTPLATPSPVRTGVPPHGLECNQCRARSDVPPCVPKGWSKSRDVPVCGNCQLSHRCCSWPSARDASCLVGPGPPEPGHRKPKSNPRKRARATRSPDVPVMYSSLSPAAAAPPNPTLRSCRSPFESSGDGVRAFGFSACFGEDGVPWPRLPASLSLFAHPTPEVPLEAVSDDLS